MAAGVGYEAGTCRNRCILCREMSMKPYDLGNTEIECYNIFFMARFSFGRQEDLITAVCCTLLLRVELILE